MSARTIDCSLDKEAVWNRVSGRRSLFLDTMYWIELADEVDSTACRMRNQLREHVAAGRIFCPVSWGTLEELFKQFGPSLERTADLMEQLSLNACFVMRSELYDWELGRSIRRLRGDPAADSLKGLFAPPAAFCGSGPQIVFSKDYPVTPDQKANVEAFLKRELSAIGIRELADKMGGSRLDETPPGYSSVAKLAQERLKGDRKKQLFIEEAGQCMYMYITPLLKSKYFGSMIPWLEQFDSGGNEEAWFQKAMAQLPALYNFVEVMVAADLQPSRTDKYNDFMDHEIMCAALAYGDVFCSKDKNIGDLLRNRTKILSRNKCHYCGSFAELEPWLAAHST